LLQNFLQSKPLGSAFYLNVLVIQVISELRLQVRSVLLAISTLGSLFFIVNANNAEIFTFLMSNLFATSVDCCGTFI